MRKCTRCNTIYENDAIFCTKCGGETVECYQPTTDSFIGDSWMSSGTSSVSRSNPSARVMGYLGLVFGILGFIFAMFMFIISIVYITESSGVFRHFMNDDFLEMHIVTLIIMGANIAARCLAAKAGCYGEKTGASVTGRVLATIGFVFNIITLAITFMGFLATT